MHDPEDTSEDYRNIKYLPAITHLARAGHIELKTSAELKDETFRQPSGRFRGYGYSDYSVFGGLSIESVDGFVMPNLGPSEWGLPKSR